MTNYKKQIVSVLAAGTLLLNLAAPVLADTTIQISGNGADSNSNANVTQNNTTAVQQSNNAVVTNNVTTNSDTGHNDANKNTNGNVQVNTGDSNVTSNVSNNLNTNVANTDCGCNSGDTTAVIAGNGADSNNKVGLNTTNTTTVKQDNNAVVANNVSTNANTGKNDANKNTGGDVQVNTGDVTVHANVSTTANSNVANVGGGSGSNGSLSAIITGNGADSYNSLKLKSNDSATVWQDNDAVVTNNVATKATTGENDANKNTGGDVQIGTGDADVTVGVDNAVNFNAANIDCGCVMDATAKIAGNGSDSNNHIDASLGNSNGVFQGGEGLGNEAVLSNNVDTGAKTGKNTGDENTGSVMGGDPEINTGDSSTNVDVNNSGNTNVVGAPLEWPTMPDMNVSFSFSFAELMAMFGMHS